MSQKNAYGAVVASPFWMAKAFGVALTVGAALLTRRAALAWGARADVALVAAVALLWGGPIAWGALSGMEVSLAAFLVAAALLAHARDRLLASAICAALAVLARPESLLLVPFVIAARQQELDELGQRMARVTRQRLQRGQRWQHELLQRLAHRHPERVLARARADLRLLSGRLVAATRIELSSRRKAFGAAVAGLHALSPLAVLGRGYAIIEGTDGHIRASVTTLKTGERVRVRMRDGRAGELVETVERNG